MNSVAVVHQGTCGQGAPGDEEELSCPGVLEPDLPLCVCHILTWCLHSECLCFVQLALSPVLVQFHVCVPVHVCTSLWHSKGMLAGVFLHLWLVHEHLLPAGGVQAPGSEQPGPQRASG